MKQAIMPHVELAENVLKWPMLSEQLEHGSSPAWWIRAGIWIGLLMSAPPPKVWSWNPSVITLVVLLLSLVAGGGYYIGHQAAVQAEMQRQLDAVAADEKRRKELEIYNSRQIDNGDGHTKPNKEKKK